MDGTRVYGKILFCKDCKNHRVILYEDRCCEGVKPGPIRMEEILTNPEIKNKNNDCKDFVKL